MNGIYVLEKTGWHFSFLIQINAIGNSFMLPELCELLEEGDSLEILIQGQNKRVNTQMIVRISGVNPGQLQKRAENLRQMVSDIMSRHHYEFSLPGEKECYALSQRVKEHLNPVFVYPDGHGYLITKPFSKDLIPALLSLPETGVSLRMMKTSLIPEEKYNSVYANWVGIDDIPALAANKGLFTSLELWGSDTSLTELCAIMKKAGYGLLPVPEYVYREDPFGIMTDCAVHYLGTCLPRIRFILKPETVCKLFFSGADRLPGIRTGVSSMIPGFLEGEGIYLGDSGGKKISIPLKTISRHAAITGMPGTGKTTFFFQILYELAEKKIPFLAIEPTKTEYRELLSIIPGFKVYTPGRSDLSPIPFNPFMPPAGITLEQFLPSLETAFVTSFSMTRPLDVIFPEVLRNCYASYGWRMGSTRESEGVTPFGMREFIEVFRDEIANSGYDPESRANLESGGVYRFQSLLNQAMLFDTDQPLPAEQLLSGYTLLELDSIDSIQVKSLIMSLLLIQLRLVIRKNQIADEKLKNVIMIDEAHVLLGESKVHEAGEADPAGQTIAFLKDMVLVNRAYGTGMIFADQSPVKLSSEIVGNVNITLSFRLGNPADRSLIGTSTGMDPDRYGSLEIGEAFLFCAGLDAPIKIKTPDFRAEKNIPSLIPDEEVKARCGNKMFKPYYDCPCEFCDIDVRQESDYITRRILNEMRPVLNDKEKLRQYISDQLDDRMAELSSSYPEKELLQKCLNMMVFKKISAAARLN